MRSRVEGALMALQALLDPVLDRGERLRQRRRIGTAGLRHVGPSSTLAAHLQRDEVDQLAGLHPRDKILGDPRDEAYLLALGGGEHDGARLELALQLVERVAQ